MTSETVIVLVLVVGCVVLGVLGLIRAAGRRSAGQNYSVLRFNSIFGIVVGVGLLVLYFGVYHR